MLTPIATSLTDRQIIAENTLEFVLRRPDGFEFKAGQHVNVKLTELLFDDKKAGRRTFTIASAPSEKKLVFATRRTGSGFKRTVEEGPQRQSVEMVGPSGNMIRDESRPAVFIAGGIGITPFRCMIADAVYRQLKQPMMLLYSNGYVSSIAYFDFFVGLAQKHSDVFTHIQTVTKDDPKNDAWSGERRRINSDFITEYVPDLSAVTFYVCGPPAMVNALTETLKKENVSQEHILSESFWGY